MERNIAKLIIVSITLLLIWGSLFYLLWQKGKAFINDPCKECANRLGKRVTCFEAVSFPSKKPIDFYPLNNSLQFVNK